MNKRDFADLKRRITGQEFELAKTILGLTDGKTPNDPEHHQPCPISDCSSDDDGFYFQCGKGTFHCRKCRFGGDLIALVGKVRNVELTEAYDIIVEAADSSGNRMKFAPKSLNSTSGLNTTTKKVQQMKQYELHEDSQFFKKVQRHRPEISFATYKKAGAVCFEGSTGSGIAIPMYTCDGETGYIRYFTDGTKKNSLGAKSGIVGKNARDALLRKQPAKIVFKTAGVSDYLAISEVIDEAGLNDKYYAFTNGAGEVENPEKFDSILRPALEGKTVAVIADNDETGEKGAKRWALEFAKYAKNVRIVRLPKEMFGCPVRVLR